MVISISELQKNISILSNLKEPILVKDKRKNKIVAKIEPIGEEDFLKKLEKRAPSKVKIDNLEEAIEQAKEAVWRKKYGIG